jgi:hypothetical protein
MLDGYLVLINEKEPHAFQSINSVKAFVKDSIKTNYENKIDDLEHREKLNDNETKELKRMKKFLEYQLDNWAERMADVLINVGRWEDMGDYELFGTKYDMTYQYWEFVWED